MDRPLDKSRCVKMVNDSGTWGSFHQHQCHRHGTIKRDGKLYCKTHDPVAVDKKRTESFKKFEDECEYRRIAFERAALEKEYCKGLTDDELRKGRKSC